MATIFQTIDWQAIVIYQPTFFDSTVNETMFSAFHWLADLLTSGAADLMNSIQNIDLLLRHAVPAL